ncbi:hypothetical protein HPB50_004334 [Hyalomma asiaticum]|uniref:Uncharacterized protein n=1 Tax=Hyalomma asiaticum TaxID=266040 RepID=A0ACB7SN37_HYAAI|nr:hypothetical protein HPB50_004334 [Hyalomma asiaticum]
MRWPARIADCFGTVCLPVRPRAQVAMVAGTFASTPRTYVVRKRTDLTTRTYMAHGGDYWYTCNNTADCDVTILYERTATAADGYMRLTRKVQYIFGGAFIRACNSYGCGPECLVLMSDDDDTGPPRLSSVSVEPQGKQTRISWRTPHVGMYNGVELEWKCSGDEGVAYNSRISENTYGVRQSVHVPSGKSENCSFNVSTYIEDPNGPRYYSTPTLATSSAGARGREQQKKTGPRERRFG